MEEGKPQPGIAANFAVLRHIALNLLRLENSAQRSLRSKRKKAAWDRDYLLQVLDGQMRSP